MRCVEKIAMKIEIIGVPPVEVTAISNSHAGGLAYATEAYLAAGLLEELAAAGAEVTGVVRPGLPAQERGSDPVVNLGLYNAHVAAAVADAIERGAKPVLAGGTCNHLVGMLAGLQRAYGPTSRIGLIWFDAHGDFNTPEPRTPRCSAACRSRSAPGSAILHGVSWPGLKFRSPPTAFSLSMSAISTTAKKP